MGNENELETMMDYEKELEQSFRTIREGDILKGTILSIGNDEIIVDLQYYTEGIIKIDEISADPDFIVGEVLHVGDQISGTVLSTDDGNGHILLSQKEANEVLAWDKLKTYLDEGTILDVKIKGVVNKGVIAYVEGIRGFIPASKLSLSYVDDLEDWLLKDIQVQVITADENEKRLVLSAKEILREKEQKERKNKVSNITPGIVTEGTVESIMPYGAFVNIGNGVSGLLHISQISEKRIKSPAAILKEGDKVTVKVIDIKDGKVSLSMKALKDVTATTIEEEYFELPEAGEATTTLGDLFKNIKL